MRNLFKGSIVLGLGLFALALLFLACLGFYLPGDFFLNLAFGWIFYLSRVLPQVHVSGTGALTAAICLAALLVGLQLFLRWLVSQMPRNAAIIDVSTPSWPIRRTAVILGMIVFLFVAGVSAVGISHQIGWLLTSPEPLVEGGGREVVARWESQNNLHHIAVAMHNYQDVKKTLPSAALYDRQGQPLLSWRVLILPYMEQESLYKEFHLDEPWDSPYNLRLLPRMPQVYAPPYRVRSAKPYSTPYQVFVGKGAAFEGKHGLRLPDDFPDGTANTLLIVEAAELVPWTKPADLLFDRKRPLPALGWTPSQGFNAALADGSARRIGILQLPSETTLRAAITRNGGETLGPDW